MDEERASAYIKGVKRVSRIWMTPQAINGYDELGWPQTQNFEAPKHFNFHKSKKKSNKGKAEKEDFIVRSIIRKITHVG